jgi:hypothetical protein
MVEAVADVDVAGGIDCHPSRVVELGGGAGAVGEPTDAGTGEGGDDAGGCDFADAIVDLVGDVEVAASVNSDRVRAVELGGGAGAVGEPGDAGPGEGGDDAGGCDFADGMVVGVGDVDVAGCIDGDPVRAVELGAGAGAVGWPGGAGPGEGGDVAGGCDFADAVIALVANVEVAVSIDRHPCREAELGGGTGSVGEPGDACAGEGGDSAEEAFDGCVVVVVEAVDDRAR